MTFAQFSKWILDIGDGKLGEVSDGEASIQIPEDLYVRNSGNPLGNIVKSTYSCLIVSMQDSSFSQDRDILAPTLEIVEKVNDYVIDLIPIEERKYLSCDIACRCDDDVGIDRCWITTEFLDDIKCFGMPLHKFRLKVGVSVMLLRNIDVSSGLCNDTQLTVVSLGKNDIGAQIVNGPHNDVRVYLTRMNLIPSYANVPITFQRRQFPLCLCFAMTINKSQGKTLSHVGLYLPSLVFTHGQLYVAVSRIKSQQGLKILSIGDGGQPSNTTTNVVYEEVFRKI